MSNIRKEIVGFIQDELEAREDNEFYTSDLAWALCESINADGSVTYSTQKAIDWIKEHWDLCAQSYENQKYNYGPESLKNPFEEPEAFMVCVYIDQVEQILNSCQTIKDKWDDSIMLDKETINKLKAEVEDAAESILGDFE